MCAWIYIYILTTHVIGVGYSPVEVDSRDVGSSRLSVASLDIGLSHLCVVGLFLMSVAS